MSVKGLSGMTSFIPEYITIYRFSTKYKIKSCFFMNINRLGSIFLGIPIETKFRSVCVTFNRHSQQAFRAHIRPFPFASGQA